MKFGKQNTFNEYYENFIKSFSKDKKFIVWGVGHASADLVDVLGDELNIKYFVDSDPEKQKSMYYGKKVYNPNSILDEDLNETRIIITPSGDMYNQIVDELEDMGIDSQYACYIEEIMNIWCWNYKNKLCISFTSIMLTSLCTLKCKGCIPYIPYHKNKGNIPLPDIKKTVDCVFKVFDEIGNLQLAGGEPFLYDKLYEVLEYLYDKYASHCSKISIISNGTIIPDKKVLETLRKYNIVVYISNYRNTIGKKSKIEELSKIFTDYKINYSVESGFGKGKVANNKWFDMGDINVRKKLSESGKRIFFNNCALNCKIAHGERWYYCNPLCGATVGGIYKDIEQNDYINLKDICKQDKSNYALNVIKFNLGYLDLGYTTFCERCNGYGRKVNNKFIDAGGQLK